LNQQLVHRLTRNDKINQRGNLFVVVGRHTLSARIMLATEIEQNTHAVFVGEPTGSRPNFVGQDVGLRLPFSGMRGSLSDLYWQSSSATLCKANRDPALEAILAYDPAPQSVR
jgi:hypothetical protein